MKEMEKIGIFEIALAAHSNFFQFIKEFKKLRFLKSPCLHVLSHDEKSYLVQRVAKERRS